MKPNIYKFTYKQSEKNVRYYYTESYNESDAIADFISYRPRVINYTIEQVDRDFNDVGRWLAHSRLRKHNRKALLRLEELEAKPDSLEKSLAIKHVKKLRIAYQLQMDSIRRHIKEKV